MIAHHLSLNWSRILLTSAYDWANLGATFIADDRKTALESCAYGEDATLKAYDKALEQDIDLPLRSILIEQENGLRQSYAEVRSMRDQFRER